MRVARTAKTFIGKALTMLVGFAAFIAISGAGYVCAGFAVPAIKDSDAYLAVRERVAPVVDNSAAYGVVRERAASAVAHFATPTPPPSTVAPSPYTQNAGPGPADIAALETTIARLLNGHRVTPLAVDPALSAVVRAHSLDMAAGGYMPQNHVNRAGQGPTERALAAGYHCRNPQSIGVAENANVVYAHTSSTLRRGGVRTYNWLTPEQLAKRAVAEWLDSPLHWRNLQDPRYRKTGVGVAFGTYQGIPHAMFVTNNFC